MEEFTGEGAGEQWGWLRTGELETAGASEKMSTSRTSRKEIVRESGIRDLTGDNVDNNNEDLVEASCTTA